MTSQPTTDSLRERAESIFAKYSGELSLQDVSILAPEEIKRRLHDLHVRQIELEIQNEELRAAQRELDVSRSRFFTLYDVAPNGYCTINQQGLILEANLTAASLLAVNRSALIDQAFSSFIANSEQDSFYLNFHKLVESGGSLCYESQLKRSDGSLIFVLLNLNCRTLDNDVEPVVVLVGISDITEQKRVESQLLAQTAFFKAVANSPQDAILVVDKDCNKVHQNDKLAEIWNIPPEVTRLADDTQQASFAASRAKDPTAFLDRVKYIYTQPDLISRDELELADGTILDRYTSPVRNAAGEYFGRIWTFRDITQRKRAEALQAETLNRLQKIASRLPGFVFQFRMRPDGTFCFPYASEGIYELFHVRPEEVAEDSSRTFALHHPDDHEMLVESILKSARELTPWKCEFRTKTSDGTVRWISGNSVPEREADGATLWHGYLHDITDSHFAAVELREAKRRLEEAQSIARTGNWSYDLQSGKQLWSKQLFQFFGQSQSEDEPDYKAMLNDFHPDDSALLDQAVKKAAHDGTPYTLTLRKRETQDGVRFFRCEGRANQDSSGKVMGLFGTATDVTAEVEREVELKLARKQAEAANRAKSEFLANMSHEIRTPLTAILGYAELLREEVNHETSAAQRQQAIDTIVVAGQHLLTIINDVLDLSKIEAEMTTIELVETSPVEVLHEVQRLLVPRATAKGLSLTQTLVTPIPDRIQCDPTRLRQILMNLVGNAIKFTELGGVTIEVSAIETDTTWRLIIDVIDTGPGLTTEQTAQLFVAFGQADSTVTRKHGGTGLGLTISRRLASLMGGTVTLARTSIGVGSCFRTELPFVPLPDAKQIKILGNANSTCTLVQPRHSQPLQGRILLAEDGPENQRLIEFILRKAGAEVDVAEHGEIALQMIGDATQTGKPYDLLITDMQMPVMDGYMLTRKLREQSSTIAIIALTAHALAEDRKRCLDAGCDDYLTKPIDKKALLALCEMRMRRA